MEDSEAQRALFQSLLEGVNRDLTLISCKPRSFPGHAPCVPPPSRGRRGETTNLDSVLSDCDTLSLEVEGDGGRDANTCLLYRTGVQLLKLGCGHLLGSSTPQYFLYLSPLSTRQNIHPVSWFRYRLKP